MGESLVGGIAWFVSMGEILVFLEFGRDREVSVVWDGF